LKGFLTRFLHTIRFPLSQSTSDTEELGDLTGSSAPCWRAWNIISGGTSQPPESYSIDRSYKDQSLNLGVEGKLSEAASLRGGYFRKESSLNPNYFHERISWQNALTLGFGYEPDKWNFVFEFSHSYASQKFTELYGNPFVESEKHVLSLSLKKIL
jgi:hypothetical protein